MFLHWWICVQRFWTSLCPIDRWASNGEDGTPGFVGGHVWWTPCVWSISLAEALCKYLGIRTWPLATKKKSLPFISFFIFPRLEKNYIHFPSTMTWQGEIYWCFFFLWIGRLWNSGRKEVFLIYYWRKLKLITKKGNSFIVKKLSSIIRFF